jgi:hypothetical protein
MTAAGRYNPYFGRVFATPINHGSSAKGFFCFCFALPSVGSKDDWLGGELLDLA